MTLQKLCDTADFPRTATEYSLSVVNDIVVFVIDGEYFAIDRKCSHMGGDLSKGKLEGKTIKCPKHGAVFNLENGDVITQVSGMAGKMKKAVKAKVYPVQIQNNAIFVDI